jgi:hypothetical protein
MVCQSDLLSNLVVVTRAFFCAFLPFGDQKKGAMTYPKDLYLEKRPKVTIFREEKKLIFHI